MTQYLTCFDCHKVVANLVLQDDTIVRAVVLCPECYAKENNIEMGDTA